MCYYITACVAPESAVEDACAAMRGAGRACDRIQNASIRASLPASSVYLDVSDRPCSCGTPLGIGRRMAIKPGSLLPKVERLRKRGWSENRIRRWLDNKEHAEGVAKRRRGTVFGINQDGLERWCEQIGRVLSVDEVASFGILLHWYGATLETERLGDIRAVRVPRDVLSAEWLADMEGDVLYVFQKQA